MNQLNFKCRCCGTFVQEKENYSLPSAEILFEYSRCFLCNSLTVINSNENFGYDEVMTNVGIEHYIEIGAGIDSMVELLDPLVKLGFNDSSHSYLELGCGFGFLIDYANHVGFGKSLGVEDANYGKAGAEILGFNLQSLSDFEKHSDKFDVVLASEVIEHVDDPFSFLKSMRERLNDNGVVVVTTPNANFVSLKNVVSNDSLTLAALSPGFHTCLFSATALEKLFLDSGFNNVRIFEKNERLVVYASPNATYAFDSGTSDFSKESYLNYLGKLSLSTNSSVRVGAHLRTFKELVNRGAVDLKAAESYNYLQEDLGEDFLKLRSLPYTEKSDIANLDSYRLNYRFHEGVFLFYAAQFERNLGNPGMQLALLEKSIRVINREISHFPQFFQESSSLRNVALERLEESLRFMNLRYFSHSRKRRTLSNSKVENFLRIVRKLIKIRS